MPRLDKQKPKVYTYRTCGLCGKTLNIYWATGYVFKRQYKQKLYYFCNWDCMRKIDKGYPINRWKRKIE